MNRVLPLLLSLNLLGCVAPEIKPENLVYVPANIALDKIDDFADRGSFPRIDKPLVQWGPLRVSTSFRTRLSRKEELRENPEPSVFNRPPSTGPGYAGTNARIDWDMIYIELRFKW